MVSPFSRGLLTEIAAKISSGRRFDMDAIMSRAVARESWKGDLCASPIQVERTSGRLDDDF